MKIIINAYQYSAAVTGTDRMAVNFLRELQKLDTTNTYYVVCSGEHYIQNTLKAPNFKIIQPRLRPRVTLAKRAVNKAWRTALPHRLKLLKADVYFSFHNMRLPHQRVAPRMIASNLDLIPFKFDEYKNLSPGQLAEIKYTAGAADAFLSISNYSKRELCDTLGVAPRKVQVIHLAADPFFDGRPRKSSLKVPPSFLLTIGGSEPRKNVALVAQAHTKLPKELQAAYPLLIAGGSWHGRPLKALQLSPHIKTLGYVDDATLASLYAQASAFVFASYYEGFGFTLLEAMTYGTPVLSATGSSLDEVAGQAALTFDPTDVDELVRQMRQVLTKPVVQRKLQAAGRQRAQEFSWPKAAAQLHQLLTSLPKGKG